MSFLLVKLACANLAVKFSAVNLLNSGAVIYLLWSSILCSRVVRVVVVAKLVILCILFLTSLILGFRAVAKLVMLGVSFLTSFILVLKVVLVLVPKLIISGILSSILLILTLCKSFSTKSFFTTSLSLLKGGLSARMTCFKCLRVYFSLKKKIIQFPLSFSLHFQQEGAPKLLICHLPTKRSV